MNNVTAIRAEDGGKYHVEFLKINTKDLTVHPIAQRKFDKRHGDRLAREFDWNKYDPISVSYQSGKYLVIRGQHRLYAIKKRNGGKDCNILCRVLYLIGDETVSGMVHGAEAAGWDIDFKPNDKNGTIKALTALKDVYLLLDHEQYIDMLKTIRVAWDGEKISVNQYMLKGMAVFYRAYYGQFKSADLVRVLSRVPVQTLIREGKGFETARGGSRGLTCGIPYARAILRRYNANRKNRLEDKI